ncbi:MAG: phosphopantothenoylcysteine synthase [Candidatus Altiarchaeota archaeon]|nr:phosphopantothenoylcysteine synthase [Candidatus Altiarchaeota archaeon]
MRVLITLGPTQEPIDEVRYITNASSGKMGTALARESIKRGYETTIVSGPVDIRLPGKAKILKIRTAEEMTKATLKELDRGYDIFISTAAIADYSPGSHKGKIRSSTEELTITLKANPKLTRKVREKFPGLFIVAFKAEYNVLKDSLIESAWSKLKKEGLDLIVANDLQKVGFGGDKTEVYVVNKRKKIDYIPLKTKNNIAKDIWAAINKEKKGGENKR